MSIHNSSSPIVLRNFPLNRFSLKPFPLKLYYSARYPQAYVVEPRSPMITFPPRIRTLWNEMRRHGCLAISGSSHTQAGSSHTQGEGFNALPGVRQVWPQGSCSLPDASPFQLTHGYQLTLPLGVCSPVSEVPGHFTPELKWPNTRASCFGCLAISLHPHPTTNFELLYRSALRVSGSLAKH